MPETIEDLSDRVDAVLAEGRYTQDCQRTARIGVAFCELLVDLLDQEQREALMVARGNLNDANAEAYKLCLNHFASRIDADQHLQATNRQKTLDRLVWVALNKNTGLSGYAAEFLIGLGDDAGLTVQQMGAVFAEHIPELQV